MDEELKGIVQRMVDAGESESNIALVIKSYNPSVKKKEPTISQSEPQKVSGTLDTKKVQAQKPSESFTLKSDNNQLNFADEIKKSQEAQAKERKELGIFSGYPGKEKNLYRINQGSWERKMPGQKDWAAISNEGSINSLNKTFGGDVKPLVLKGKYAGAVEDTFKAKEEALSKISGKLIGKEEGDVVAFIQAKFPDFQVRKEGTFTDEIKLIAPNKQTLTVSLDNFTDGDDSARALELKEWMRTNSNTELAKATTELDKAEGVRQGTRFAVPGDKEYVENSPYGQPLVSTVKQTILDEVGATNLIKEKEVKEKRAELAKAQAKSFDSIRADIASSNLSDEEVNAKLASLPHDNETAKRVNSYAKDVLNVAKSKDAKAKELNDLVDDISSRIESGEITKEQYESEYKKVIEDKTKEVENAQDLLRKEAATVSSFSKSLNESVAKNYIIAQTKGTVGGGVASSFLKGLTYLPRLASGGAITAQDQKELVELVTGSGTTAEYMASEDRGDLTKALFSITESLGAMASVGGAGGVAGKLPFFAQGYLNMKDEFDEIPDMTETEKVLMSSLYGVGSAVLEKFGLDFAMGKTGVGKSITNSIMKSAFKTIPKNATKEMIEIAIANSAQKMIAQAGVKTLGAMAAEGATETTQAFFEAGIKESYDALKDVEYFNNKPDKEGNPTNKTAWDITKDALYEGYLGALGGGLMSSVSQSTNVLKGIANKENTSLLIDIANSVDADETVLADLKSKMIAGKITQAEAEETYQSFRKITGHVKSIPDGLTKLEKAASLKLLVEKDNLTKQIAGKDKALVYTQIERVNAINEELKTISINNSKDATTEIKQESIPVESSINEYKGTSEGQQEVGITEGEQRKTTINEADNSNINQPSQEEEITAATPVVEQEAIVEAPITEEEVITPEAQTQEATVETPAAQQQPVAEEVAPVKMESPKKRLERAKAVQPTTPKQMVSQFFLNKGKISRTIIEELFGKKGRKPTKGEIFARANLYDPNSTDKLDTIAHSIWENNGGIESQYDTQDIKEALMEIVLADYKFSSLADNLLSDGGAKVVAEEDQFWFDKAIEAQMEEQQASPANIEADKEFKASRTQEQEQELANDIEAFEKEYASKQESAPESEDKVLEWLDKAIKYTGSKGKLYDASLGIPIALSNAALKIVREAYVATKNLHQAIKAGYDHLKANGIDITELEYKDSFVNKMAVKTPAEIRKAYQQGKSEVRDELTPVIKDLRTKARDKARDRKVVAETIKAMVGKGRISTKQAANLVKRFNSVNVNNPKTLSAFYEYAERIMDNASYAQELSDAFSLRSKIIKSSKNKDNQAEVKSIARKFGKIKPNLIEDMTEYIAQAKSILEAVRVSKETGMRGAIDLAIANDYIQKEIANQEKQVEESDEWNEFEKEVLANDNAVVAAEKELEMRRTLDSRFEILSGVIEFMLGGTNPISGEDVEYTPKQRDIISRVLKMDLSKLSIQEAHRINEGLDNFIQNGIVSGLEFRVAFYEGRLGAEEVLNKKGISYRKMKHLFSGALGRAKAQQLATLGILTDSLFGGVNAALYIESRSGIAEFSEGANKTERQHNEVIDAYIKKFYKTNKAGFDVKYVNGQAFNSAFNNYERGMLAFIKRSVHGSDAEKAAELNRRIGIIKKGIADLKVSGKSQGKNSNETEMAKIYEELFNKLELDKENITISEIESKVDPANAEAVNDWINIWGENYGNLAEVSASVYNTVLAEDPGYTPDMFSRLSNATTEVDPKEAERAGSFGSVISLEKSPTGVLIESTKPAVLNERFPNFDFDINNSRALRSAMLDVNTAGATQKMNGFLSSKNINKIIPDEKDRKLWVDRVKGYQKRTRSEAASNSESLDKINRTANLIATYGTVKTLGGITQVIKQTIPVFISTNINAGGFSFTEIGDSSFNEWIDNLDMGISQRGLDASTTIDSINDKLDKSDFGNAKTIAKAFRKINELPLKKFLVKGDVFIARAAFATYYKKKAGIPLTQKVDWKNHTLDIEAARYAMAMIDRQQNISESQKGGDLSTTKDARVKIGSKALLPFSGFVLNQKQRMNADMRTMLNRGAGTEAQLKAFASLAGMTAEAVSYYAMSFGIKAGIIALIYKAMGEEEPEEDKEKRIKNAGLTGLSNFTKDMLSPLPILDGVVTWGLNKAGELVPVDAAAINKKVDEENKKRKAEYKFDMDDEEEKKFREKAIKAEAIKFTDYEKITPVDLGVISIGIDKAIEQYDLTKAGTSGEVEVVFNGNVTKKYLLPEDREVMKKVAAANAMYLIVGLPTEVNEISRVVKKMMTKKALTEAQHEKYQEFKKVYKKEPNGYQLDLIKTRSKKENTMSLINSLEQSGMSQKAKEDYVKNKLK